MSASILLVRPLVDTLERVGVGRPRFLAAANLTQAQLDDCDLRLPMPAYARALRAAIALSNDPALGLHIGAHASTAGYDVLAHLSEHAETLRQSLDTIARYSQILCADPRVSFDEGASCASIRCVFPPGDSPELRFSAEFTQVGFLALIRRFAGPDALPHAVYFSYPAPDYRAEYTRVFGGRERFDQDFIGVDFDRVWLDRSQLHKNRELYALLESQAQRALDRLGFEQRVAPRVEDYLVAHDPRRTPAMHEVARHLGMSARSLRRRLSAEGASYKDAVERARARIAQRLLEDTRLSIQETAYAMGFATPAAFHRAFKRWTEMTPKSYQLSLPRSAAAALAHSAKPNGSHPHARVLHARSRHHGAERTSDR